MTDISWVKTREEGQFFERKGCYDYSKGKPKLRHARDVALDIAETLSAMANADGGTLAVGVEDNGDVTGANYTQDRLDLLRRAPHELVRPPILAKVREENLDGNLILLYDTDWSRDIHQLTDGRYLLRVGDRNMPFPAGDMQAIKDSRRLRATEVRIVSEASVSDLDMSLVAEFASKTGRRESPIELLSEYRVLENRNGTPAVTLAALLLFGKDPGKWHPRCGIDFVKYEGTRRKHGESLNIIKQRRLELPLVLLIEEAYRTVEPHVRERQQLVDLFFEERFEYPTFAWQEAIVNAVAHRDYRYEGLGIEIWMFDDRMEVRSPGGLVEPVTIEHLRRREQVHASRNPRIVRVLTDLGYMREQGEGVPRMFDAMEREGLCPPEFEIEAEAVFTVTLKNEPIYSRETVRWLQELVPLQLTANQKRLLAYAREHGNTFTSRSYQRLAGVDIYSASRDIKDLIRKGVVKMPKKGGRIYEVVSRVGGSQDKPTEYVAIEDLLRERGWVRNEDFRSRLGLSTYKASQVARNLVATGWLRPEGPRKTRRYMPSR